jgi:hypothetical protein
MFVRAQVVVVSPKETSHEYKVLTWGRGSYGQLGHGSGRIKIPDKQVRSVCGYRVCARAFKPNYFHTFHILYGYICAHTYMHLHMRMHSLEGERVFTRQEPANTWGSNAQRQRTNSSKTSAR